MAGPREVAGKLLNKDKIDYGMILMAKLGMENDGKYLPILECLHTKLLHYPPDKNEDKEVTLTQWYFNGRWIRYL